ncbi:hypothetical protein EON65_32965 [archaeon]|nr:MAG: hypothetical protein EON65_32965 [archaeon]
MTSPWCNRGQSHPYPDTTRARLQTKSDSTADKEMLGAVEAVLHKWKLHQTMQDLPETGRPSILQDRTKRRPR